MYGYIRQFALPRGVSFADAAAFRGISIIDLFPKPIRLSSLPQIVPGPQQPATGLNGSLNFNPVLWALRALLRIYDVVFFAGEVSFLLDAKFVLSVRHIVSHSTLVNQSINHYESVLFFVSEAVAVFL